MRIVTLILMLVICEGSFAQGFAKNLKFYICPTKLAAQQCNADCEFRGIETEYKVNPNNHTVMAIDRELKENSRESRILERCQVVDAENWQCSRVPNKLFDKQVTTMTNGKVFIDSVLAVGKTQMYGCEK